MNFSVRIAKSAGKDIRKLGTSDQKKLRRVLEGFRARLPTTHVKKLGGLKEAYRYRLGKIRVIYSVDHKGKIVWIHGIRYRKEAYRR